MIKKGYFVLTLATFCLTTPSSFAQEKSATLANVQQANASLSLKELFLHMPQEVCPNLSEYNRLEIIDNQKNNKPLETRNLFNGTSKMNVLTDTFASLAITDSSEKTFKMLTLTDRRSIIAVVTTIHAEGKSDSSIDFYDTEWKHLDAHAYIDEPTSKEFRTLSLSKDENTLIITTSNAMAIQVDGSNNKPEIEATTTKLTWNGEKFSNLLI